MATYSVLENLMNSNEPEVFSFQQQQTDLLNIAKYSWDRSNFHFYHTYFLFH
jgi:hypothetical protein